MGLCAICREPLDDPEDIEMTDIEYVEHEGKKYPAMGIMVHKHCKESEI